jgi:uncharacterized protein YutE (UPF0331/DUF86 family)
VIDSVLVTRKITLIAKDLEAMTPYSAMTLEGYLADPVHELVVERYLERTIGRMIDINYHLVTALGEPPPRDYFESFTALGRLGVLPAELARSIAQSAGLRNRIVHEYDEIDEAKVHDALAQALQETPRYLDHVHRFVQGGAKAGEAGLEK